MEKLKGHIGIVYKYRQQAWIQVIITEALQCYMNGEYVLKTRDTPTAGNNFISISVPLQCSRVYRCI